MPSFRWLRQSIWRTIEAHDFLCFTAAPRGLRTSLLKERILRHIEDLNKDPVVFRWRYKLEEEAVS